MRVIYRTPLRKKKRSEKSYNEMAKTPNYYIFQGGPELIKYWLVPEEWTGHKWYWSANKHVVAGDKAFIYLTSPQSRIVGEVDVMGEPFFNGQPYAFDNPHMNDKWCVEVGNPIPFTNTALDYTGGGPVHLSMMNLRKLFGKDWGWVRYPRGNTRVPDEILPALLELASQSRQKPVCPRGCDNGYIVKETWHGETRTVCPACGGN